MTEWKKCISDKGIEKIDKMIDDLIDMIDDKKGQNLAGLLYLLTFLFLWTLRKKVILFWE